MYFSFKIFLEYIGVMKKELEILQAHYKKLMVQRSKISAANSIHLTSFPLADGLKKGEISFTEDNEGFVLGLDAPGDLSGGFALVKEGLLKEIDFDLNDLRIRLRESGIEV